MKRRLFKRKLTERNTYIFNVHPDKIVAHELENYAFEKKISMTEAFRHGIDLLLRQYRIEHILDVKK